MRSQLAEAHSAPPQFRLWVAWVVACAGLATQQPAFGECVPNGGPDWIDAAPPLSMPVRPADCEPVNQTPPDLSWPRMEKASGYEIELVPANGDPVRVVADRNWYLWPRALTAGAYRWRVRPLAGGSWSRWRAFAVDANALPFVVAPSDALAARAQAKPHPRAFPKGEAAIALQRALEGSRRYGLSKLMSQLESTANARYADDETALVFGERGAYARKSTRIKKHAAPAIDRMLGACLMWMVHGKPADLDVARDQLKHIVGWDANAGTGATEHQIAGRLVWSLALAYDWLYHELTEKERRTTREAIAVRMEGMLGEFRIAAGNLDGMPYNSHGWVALGEMAAASALLVGDDPRADRWFDLTVRPFAFLLSPWGGHDGGMGNGTPYGIWDLTALMLPMDILARSVELDLYRKAYMRNLGQFMLQFLPPGSPSMLFGDAAEQASGLYVGDFARAYALRVPDATYQWYAQQWVPRKVDSLVHLLAPVTEPAGWLDAPVAVANGMHALSTGWVAMHSDILDRSRLSVYFKSSPYGSFNHSHADQNSLVVVAGGKPLLIDSGYRDYNGSPHAREWYTGTRAHNAITFDGGRGQVQGDRGVAGRIVSYRQDADFDIVTGDASAAYGAKQISARRSLLLLRPDMLVVYDRLQSFVGRIWEWNLHASTPFVQLAGDVRRVGFGEGKTCLTLLVPDAVRFEQTDAFSVAPETEQRLASQWHGRFVTEQPLTEAAFLAVLDLKCRQPIAIDVKRDGANLSLTAGGRKFMLTEDGFIALR